MKYGDPGFFGLKNGVDSGFVQRASSDCTPSDSAIEVGRRLARRVFNERGNHSEAHIGEQELAGLLMAAYMLGKRGT